MPSRLTTALGHRGLRRAATVPAVFAAAAALTGTAGVWAPVAAGLDLVDDEASMRRLRLLSFAWGWSVLESAGVGLAAGAWAVGRRGDIDFHYRLQRWWADRLVALLRSTAGLRFEISGIEQLAPGPVVMCAQHASLPDALIPMVLLGQVGMRPRYVMKDDLLLDPCLDIVGGRLPNHFVDRDPDDNTFELSWLRQLAAGAGSGDACVIFPEGGVVTDRYRMRAVERIAERDPARADAVSSLRVLGPVRPGGTAALLRGAPTADLVLVTHRGLEGMQRLASAPAHVPLEAPVRVEVARIPRAEIPDGDEFVPWFDERWAERDRDVAGWVGDPH